VQRQMSKHKGDNLSESIVKARGSVHNQCYAVGKPSISRQPRLEVLFKQY